MLRPAVNTFPQRRAKKDPPERGHVMRIRPWGIYPTPFLRDATQARLNVGVCAKRRLR